MQTRSHTSFTRTSTIVGILLALGACGTVDRVPSQPPPTPPPAADPGAQLGSDKEFFGLDIPRSGVVPGFTREDYNPDFGTVFWSHPGGSDASLHLIGKHLDGVAARLAVGDDTAGWQAGPATRTARGEYAMVTVDPSSSRFVYVLDFGSKAVSCEAPADAAPVRDLIRLCESVHAGSGCPDRLEEFVQRAIQVPSDRRYTAEACVPGRFPQPGYLVVLSTFSDDVREYVYLAVDPAGGFIAQATRPLGAGERFEQLTTDVAAIADGFEVHLANAETGTREADRLTLRGQTFAIVRTP
jgi:hypothetical protein